MARKKMLCINMIKNNSCPYNYKCMYAHNLDEQLVDPLKKKAYDIIKSVDKHNIDLSQDDELARIFMIYTKVCNECKNNKCTGGYNCKYGVVHDDYQVCYNDFMYGSCYNTGCKKIHLTKKGLLPVTKQREKQKIRDKIIGSNFFININKDNNIKSTNNDSDESPISIEKTKKYLNEYDSDENCDDSIFIYTE